jgi:chorismate mutase/prephenate dehydratase
MSPSSKNGPPENEPSMAELRRKIDAVDEEVVTLLNKRLELAGLIGSIKKKKGLPVVDFSREREVLKKLAARNKGPLPPETLRYVYAEVMAAARKIQTPLKVSFLGPEATFTHLAAMSHFGHATTFEAQAGIREVFESVERKNSQFGVVPVENSIEGTVNHTLDLFFSSDLRICGEIYMHISHDLLSKQTSPDQVRTVFSHPQALAQCRLWLRQNLPEANAVPCASTSEAARKACETPGSAAIASSLAAMVYDLVVLASHIQDASHNVTRFLVIGRDSPTPTGNDKTSLLFATPHVPGALFKVLKPIADAGINMNKLESRPAKNAPWHYLFFVDVEGHIEDLKVKGVFEQMQTVCAFVKWLGSYPRQDVPV